VLCFSCSQGVPKAAQACNGPVLIAPRPFSDATASRRVAARGYQEPREDTYILNATTVEYLLLKFVLYTVWKKKHVGKNAIGLQVALWEVHVGYPALVRYLCRGHMASKV
jgi:hypothetical protein